MSGGNAADNRRRRRARRPGNSVVRFPFAPGVPGSLLRRAGLTCAWGAWMETVELAITAFVTLFVIFDPLGNIPIFLALRAVRA